MSNTITNSDGEFNKTGKINLEGLNIDLSVILGEQLASEYFKHISDEQLQVLFDYMTSEIWKKERDWSKEEMSEKYVLNYQKRDSYYNSKSEAPAIAQYARKQLEEKLKEDIAKKIEEIVETDEYKKRAEEIAQEIVEYATEGYKKDMMARIKARLVEDPLSSDFFGGINIRSIIREEIYNAVRTQ